MSSWSNCFEPSYLAIALSRPAYSSGRRFLFSGRRQERPGAHALRHQLVGKSGQVCTPSDTSSPGPKTRRPTKSGGGRKTSSTVLPQLPSWMEYARGGSVRPVRRPPSMAYRSHQVGAGDVERKRFSHPARPGLKRRSQDHRRKSERGGRRDGLIPPRG